MSRFGVPVSGFVAGNWRDVGLWAAPGRICAGNSCVPAKLDYMCSK